MCFSEVFKAKFSHTGTTLKLLDMNENCNIQINMYFYHCGTHVRVNSFFCQQGTLHCCIHTHWPISEYGHLSDSGYWCQILPQLPEQGQKQTSSSTNAQQSPKQTHWALETEWWWGWCGGCFYTSRPPNFNNFFTKYYSCSGVAFLKNLEWWLLMWRWMSTSYVTLFIYSLCHQGKNASHKSLTNYCIFCCYYNSSHIINTYLTHYS